MPHLVVCAASVALHERSMYRARKDHHCDHTVRGNQQKCMKFGDKDQKPRVRFWEVVQIVREAFSNLLAPVREPSSSPSIPSPIEESAPFSSLRSDLSAIRRVGFPPNEKVESFRVVDQRNVENPQTSTIHSSPSRIVVTIPNHGMVITVPCQVLHLRESTTAPASSNDERSCDLLFCRIEAIFI
jgi:hypothetical protein